MKLLLIAFVCCLSLSSGQCQAQLSLRYDNSDGIVTSGTHTTFTSAKRLRFFASIEAKGDSPQAAIKKLKAEKSAYLEVIGKADAIEDSVELTMTTISEWNPVQQSGGVFAIRPEQGLIEPKVDSEDVTATTKISFDVSLDGIDPDDFPVRIFEITKLLPSYTGFDSPEVVVIYVGEIDAASRLAARKKAYDKAKAEATALASLTGRPLGKLIAISGYTGGGNSYPSSPNGLTSGFKLKRDEVVASAPQNLLLEYTVNLRHEIAESK